MDKFIITNVHDATPQKPQIIPNLFLIFFLVYEKKKNVKNNYFLIKKYYYFYYENL